MASNGRWNSGEDSPDAACTKERALLVAGSRARGAHVPAPASRPPTMVHAACMGAVCHTRVCLESTVWYGTHGTAWSMGQAYRTHDREPSCFENDFRPGSWQRGAGGLTLITVLCAPRTVVCRGLYRVHAVPVETLFCLGPQYSCTLVHSTHRRRRSGRQPPTRRYRVMGLHLCNM